MTTLNKTIRGTAPLLLWACLLPCHAADAEAGADEIVIEFETGAPAEDGEIVIDPGDTAAPAPAPATPPPGGEIVIEPAGAAADGLLVIEPSTAPPDPAGGSAAAAAGALRGGVDEMRVEVGALDGAAAPVDSTGYLHAAASLSYAPDVAWEVTAGVRVDAHHQGGSPDFTKLDLDYGETYLRYRGDALRLTVGAQKILWGRIDELPPTDRLSVVDLSRFILDDLPQRRRPTLAVRAEAFLAAGKLDLVWVPVFRGAVLPERDSLWFPVDRARGRLLGIVPDPALAAIVQSAAFDEDAPDGDGGWGLRYSHTTSAVDFGLTLQHNRQTTPYYAFQPATTTFEARYPRAWSYAADAAFERGGVTWRGEVAWISRQPVTRTDFRYDTVEAVNWAAGMEFHPGDGDARVNLQLVGLNLVDAPAVLDRTEIYSLNGAVDLPFAHDRWRLNTRFFVGLDTHDLYLNPELAFLGWEPHELYLAAHYFEGAANTLGGFHEGHSVVTLGWRSSF